MVLANLVIYVNALCGQYTITPDPQTALTLGIHVDLVTLEYFNQILLSRSTCKVTQ